MPSKFLQLQQKYLSSFETKAQDIELAWKKSDYDGLKELLHKLAGSSGSYGFSDISMLSRQTIDFIKNQTEQTTELIEEKVISLTALLRHHKN